MTDPTTVDSIFSAALERPSSEACAAYLDEACAGDEALRRRVDRLLRAHRRARGFLERPIEAVANLAGAPARGRSLGFLAPSSRPDSLGRLGPFEVLEVVGEGGMGLVLRAFDGTLNRVVAIKVLAGPLSAAGPTRRRFVREARVAASVIHENVVAIHAVDDGPVPYLVMAFVQGPTLQGKIDREGPLPLAEILSIGKQIAAGLAAAHAEGLVHRDVKPSHILLENGVERVKITDFGLARAVNDPNMTHQGLIAGTPAYMAPEQASGGKVDARADLFSLGSVLHAMCTGQAPFRGETVLAVLRQVCDAAPCPVRRLSPGIPTWLESLIARLHDRDPAKRGPSAAEVAELLGQRLAELREGRPIADAPRSRMGPILAKLLVLAAGLGAGGAAGMTGLRGIAARLLSPGGTRAFEVSNPGDNEGGRDIPRSGREPGPAAPPPGDIAGLPGEGQVAAVARRLRDLNPGFDGEPHPTIIDGEVKCLQLWADRIENLEPIRALRSLESLDSRGSRRGAGRLVDLGPLRGMRLKWLAVGDTRVVDLGPLERMPLEELHLHETDVADIRPPATMGGLRVLGLQSTRVDDLGPLRGAGLRSLDLYGCYNVVDLAPLGGMPLSYLNLSGVAATNLAPLQSLTTLEILILDDLPVADIAFVRGLPLKNLSIRHTNVEDLAPILGLPLEEIRLDYRPDREAFLRSLAGLKRINERPAAGFWRPPAGR